MIDLIEAEKSTPTSDVFLTEISVNLDGRPVVDKFPAKIVIVLLVSF